MLTSRLFSDSTQLAAAAVDDRAHVVPGAVGRHVGKIQAALEILDDADIPLDEWIAMQNGAGTTAAILSYKEKRKIINPAYQTRADNIVGKMTIARMDKELLEAERTAGFGQRALRRCPQCGPEPILSRTNAADDLLRVEARNNARGLTGWVLPQQVALGHPHSSPVGRLPQFNPMDHFPPPVGFRQPTIIR